MNSPDLAQDLYEQALQDFKEGNISKAIGGLEEAVRLKPSFPDAYEALGLLYFREKRLEEAIVLLRELINREPENRMAHTNLSRFYVAKGMIEEAELEQAEARRLSWKDELRAKKEAGEDVSELNSQKSFEEGLERRIRSFQKVIELDPNDVLGYFSLGSAYLEGKRFGPAREAFEKAVTVGPDHSPSYLGLGQAYEALGRKEDAISIYKKGVPVADKHGDIIPMKKMETRMTKLELEKETKP